MLNINTATIPDLKKAGLKEVDALILSKDRINSGTYHSKGDLPENISKEAFLILEKIIIDGGVSFSHERLNELDIAIHPMPMITSALNFNIVFTFNLQSEGTIYKHILPFSLRGPNKYNIFDISYDHIIEIEIFQDKELLHSRILRPLHNEVTKALSYEVSELSESEFVLPDNLTIFAKLFISTNKKGDNITLSSIKELRFQKSGQFITVTNPDQRFDGYNLSYGLIKSSNVDSVKRILSSNPNLITQATSLDTTDIDTANLISHFRLYNTNFEFDGSFNIKQNIKKTADNYIGWIWLLSGPQLYFGFQSDNEISTLQSDLIIVLPTFDITSISEDIPYDVSEKTLLNRPDIFSDDPGTSCKTFNNPNRIIGEKRFSSILRVTQPQVKEALTNTARFSAKDTHVVEYPRKEINDDRQIEYENKDRKKYQARSVSTGHILEFAVRWRSNGYSLGDIAYSMTLAPRQTRRIVKVDFQRRERAKRQEDSLSDDQVSDVTLSNRDYNNTVSSGLKEWSRGRSSTKVSAVAVGGGFAGPGFVIGGGATHGRSASTASQEGGRNVAASEEQQVRDAIRRHGESLRSFENTIVTEMEQEESVEGVSEVVRNINYCHSLSIIYYDILRHLRVDTELAGIRECIFVPMEIRDFDDKRLLRHKQTLSRYARGWVERDVYRHLNDIQNNFVTSDIPKGTRADHPLIALSGSIYLQIGINIPETGEEIEEIDKATEPKQIIALRASLGPFGNLMPIALDVIAKRIVRASDTERDNYFQTDIAPHMARAYLDQLTLEVSGRKIESADFTMVGSYRYGTTLRVDFTIKPDGIIARKDVTQITIKAKSDLPKRSFINVRSSTIKFATNYYSGRKTSDSGYRDLIDSKTGQPDANGADLKFPLNSLDRLNYQEKLLKGYKDLKLKLEENTFYYHKAIWWSMDHDELYTLLDGYSLTNEDGRSLASLAEQRPIGILGNSLIFRTSTDKPIDPMFENFSSLLAHYRSSLPKSDPMRISLPTDGLYARAHMDDCEACEEHDGSMDWVLNQTDPALADLPVELLMSRRTEPQGLTPTDFPDTIINLQNAPVAPSPSGLSDAFSTVTKGDSFRDMAGLAGTQKAASDAINVAAGLANNFGGMALQNRLAELKSDATAGRDLKSVVAAAGQAVNKGYMTADDAKQFVKDFADKKTHSKDQKRADQDIKNDKNIIDSGREATIVKADEEGVKVTSIGEKASEGGEDNTVNIHHNITAMEQSKGKSCWAAAATIMLNWKNKTTNNEEKTLRIAGKKINDKNYYVNIFNADTGLMANEKEDFIASLDMLAEGPANYLLESYISWLEQYGPLWVTLDANGGKGFSPHAVILFGIQGNPSINPDKVVFSFINPTDGKNFSKTFTEFRIYYEQMVTDNPSNSLFVQVVRFRDVIIQGEGSGSLIDDFKNSVASMQTVLWKSDLVTTAQTELLNWRNSSGKKILEKGQEKMIKKYYLATGKNDKSAEKEAELAANGVGKDSRAWSAAFICYCVKQAGITEKDGFKFSGRHLTYITHSIVNRLNSDDTRRFWYFDLEEHEPEIGDLICLNRKPSGSNKYTNWSFDKLKNKFIRETNEIYSAKDVLGSSHTDIIIDKYKRSGHMWIKTIGGNVRDTVDYKVFRLNSSGKVDRIESSTTLNRNHHAFGYIHII